MVMDFDEFHRSVKKNANKFNVIDLCKVEMSIRGKCNRKGRFVGGGGGGRGS